MDDASIDYPSSTDAETALRQRDEIAGRVHRGSAWYRHYLLCVAALILATGLVLGLVPFGRWTPGVLIGLDALVLVAVGINIWSRSRPVTPIGMGARYGRLKKAWLALYLVTGEAGILWFPGNPAYWIPVTLAVVLPVLLVYRHQLSR